MNADTVSDAERPFLTCHNSIEDTMKNHIRNTTGSDPMLLLLGAIDNQMHGGHPGGDIEKMEAQGQRELAASEVLPTECPAECRAALEAAGVVFGAPVKGDELFTHVTLPSNWKLVPSDHSMWTDLVDAKGKVRAAIFYKAAFYDRRADMRLV